VVLGDGGRVKKEERVEKKFCPECALLPRGKGWSLETGRDGFRRMKWKVRYKSHSLLFSSY
jgi:hypothetical protein